MTARYYFGIGGQQLGPLDDETITRRIKEGSITRATLAWCEGMAQWEAVGKIAELTRAFGALLGEGAKPPPMPGAAPPAGATPPPFPGGSQAGPGGAAAGPRGNDSATPPGLSPLEASAYRFVLSIFRAWGGRSTPVRDYVLRNPKRAVPVAAITLVILLIVILSIPSLFETTPEQTPAVTADLPQQQQAAPPANWQEGYRAWQDTQRYNQGVIDDVYKYRRDSQDRMDETYRRGTYDWYDKSND